MNADDYELPARPSPERVRKARLAAGHTLEYAASLIGLGAAPRWSEYENGKRTMPAPSWAWYLLATGQHPDLSLRRRSRG